ncbi:MAG: hypothetical protein ABFS45_17305 [Pseudomonadota bacterium]
MKRYRIESGDMKTVVFADSPKGAVEKALREHHRPDAKLGRLIGVQAYGEEKYYILTEPFLVEFRAKLGRFPKPSEDAPPAVQLEWGLRETGMTETELTRDFMLHLIDQGKNPFEGMPERLLTDARRDYPDIVERAYTKFGFPRPKRWWRFW